MKQVKLVFGDPQSATSPPRKALAALRNFLHAEPRMGADGGMGPQISESGSVRVMSCLIF